MQKNNTFCFFSTKIVPNSCFGPVRLGKIASNRRILRERSRPYQQKRLDVAEAYLTIFLHQAFIIAG
jgi:hypothetical protein